MRVSFNAEHQQIDEGMPSERRVFRTNHCTYYTEWGNELGYERTKEDLCRVLAKIELGL